MASSFHHRLTPRFSDLDALGHVNNAAYLSYMEEARVAFFRGVHGTRDLPPWEFVVARVEIDYRRPLVLADEVDVALTLDRWGASSFDFAYEARVGSGVAFEARSVQVFVDPGTGRAKPVPDDFRKRVDAFLNAG